MGDTERSNKIKRKKRKTLLPRRLFPFSYYSHSSFATSTTSAWHSDFLILFVCNLPFDWKQCYTASQQKRFSCWRKKYENWDACDVGVARNRVVRNGSAIWLTAICSLCVLVCVHSDHYEWWFVSFVYTFVCTHNLNWIYLLWLASVFSRATTSDADWKMINNIWHYRQPQET